MMPLHEFEVTPEVLNRVQPQVSCVQGDQKDFSIPDNLYSDQSLQQAGFKSPPGRDEEKNGKMLRDEFVSLGAIHYSENDLGSAGWRMAMEDCPEEGLEWSNGQTQTKRMESPPLSQQSDRAGLPQQQHQATLHIHSLPPAYHHFRMPSSNNQLQVSSHHRDQIEAQPSVFDLINIGVDASCVLRVRRRATTPAPPSPFVAISGSATVNTTDGSPPPLPPPSKKRLSADILMPPPPPQLPPYLRSVHNHLIIASHSLASMSHNIS
jgi:hypothetical protein